MLPRTVLAPFALLLTLGVPAASAQCTIDNESLCDLSTNTGFADLFGDFGDLALIFLALVVVALVIVLLLSLIFRLQPQRLLRFEAAEKLRDVEPGATAKFKLELENLNRRFPVDVFLERPETPPEWTHEVAAAILLPSGFRVPQALSQTQSFPLSSASRGANRAVVEVKLKAPAEQRGEETFDYELRAVPVFRGRLRKSRARKATLTALVTPNLPIVKILKVVHDPPQIRAGTPVVTRAFLANKGEREALEVAVKFTLNGQEVDRKIVPALGLRSETQVEFNWVPQPGENKIRVALES